MAVRGSEAKTEVTQQLLKAFNGSFLCDDNKTIRIPVMENGEIIEIKVALTAAKDVIGNGIVAPKEEIKTENDLPFDPDSLTPTQEEIEMTKRMVAAINKFKS